MHSEVISVCHESCAWLIFQQCSLRAASHPRLPYRHLQYNADFGVTIWRVLCGESTKCFIALHSVSILFAIRGIAHIRLSAATGRVAREELMPQGTLTEHPPPPIQAWKCSVERAGGPVPTNLLEYPAREFKEAFSLCGKAARYGSLV